MKKVTQETHRKPFLHYSLHGYANIAPGHKFYYTSLNAVSACSGLLGIQVANSHDALMLIKSQYKYENTHVEVAGVKCSGQLSKTAKEVAQVIRYTAFATLLRM